MFTTSRLQVLAAAALAAISIGAAHAAPTTVTFNGDAIGFKPNNFVSGGVTFSDTLGADLSVENLDLGQCFSNCLLVNGDDTSALAMSFSGVMTSLSLEFGNDDPNYASPGALALLQLFLGNVQVGEVSVTMNLDDIMNQTVSYTGTGFDNAVFAYTNAAKQRINLIEVVDNITYDNTATVPEPTSLALVGLSLAGLGLARRHRKA